MAPATPGKDGETTRPFVLFLCHPLTGHLTPSIKIAEALRSRGFDVSFLGPTAHKERIIGAGVAFYPLLDDADYDDLQYYSKENPPTPGYWDRSWAGRALIDVRLQWLQPIPAQWRSVQSALAALDKRDPEREVVIISEAVFHGILPLLCGAPIAVKKPRAILVLSVTVPMLRSKHLPPFGFPGLFDADLSRRKDTERVWRLWGQNSNDMLELLNTQLLKLGAARLLQGPFMNGEMYADVTGFMQLGVPSFFFPRSDWPAHFAFVGIIPAAKPAGGWGTLPEWWRDVDTRTRRQGVKVVVVAQGTVETDPGELILPTIWAMAGRTDVLVVAILGRKGATLPADGKPLPANARVTDYLHYDAVLPHAHAWVHNAGMGAVQHGIANGVPMVVAGEGQDKTENAKRVAYSGIGVDLGTAKPKVAKVRKAVEAVLDVQSYKERVEVLRREAEELDCYSAVERRVLDPEFDRRRFPGEHVIKHDQLRANN